MSIPEILLAVAFWGGGAWMAYVYVGYGALLRLLTKLRGKSRRPIHFRDDAWPSICAVLTVHNEEDTIAARLNNLLSQVYPEGRLDILVASDGSTDRTDLLVAELAAGRPMRLLRLERLGKSFAQNAAVAQSSADIVVLTDAQTIFDAGCIRQMAAAFADPSVGCVTAHVQFTKGEGAISQSQDHYWRHELALREHESDLGILAVASGQAMAFRRALFNELPSFSGDDCIIPLDVLRQGYVVVHCRHALAYDVMPNDLAGEFRARIRMTARNWAGTWLFPSLLNPLRHPGYSLSLWSHKLLRWLGPVVLILIGLAAIGLSAYGHQSPAVITAAALVLTVAGFLADRRGLRLPVAGAAYSFALANAGFLLGIANAIFGSQVSVYRR